MDVTEGSIIMFGMSLKACCHILMRALNDSFFSPATLRIVFSTSSKLREFLRDERDYNRNAEYAEAIYSCSDT